MFVDRVRIKIKAGSGGDGRMSFHTEKFVANGGPDGGDGGKGGDLVMVATTSMTTLLEYYYAKHFRAKDGEPGDTRKCYGRSAEDLILKVPMGTVVRDAESGAVVADLVEADRPVVVLKGGRGGLGNAHFATSRRQSPRFAQQGEKTVEHTVELELKTIADVGLVGYPNVGKSTLLSVISAARPKIANYHFTTLSPNLGMVRVHDQSFLVADIPGLIEGASEGAGLGHEFLRHIERTRLIVHVVDISGEEGRDPVEDFRKINAELAAYSPKLAKRKQIVALNKCDSLADDAAIEKFRAAVGKRVKVVPISAATRYNVDKLLSAVAETLVKIPPEIPEEFDLYDWGETDGKDFEIVKLDEHIYEIRGGLVDRIARNVRFDNYDSMQYFQRMLRTYGIIKQLYRLGAANGDTIVMQDMEFDFVE